MPQKTLEERFWEKVDRGGPDDCWTWRAYVNPSGYGQFKVQRVSAKAHRVSYEIAHGPIPEGLLVRHSCDTPLCVNPAHLSVGTQADNIADKVRRDRLAREFAHPNTKLSDEQVRDVYRLAWQGWRHEDIADAFGVGVQYVNKIKRRHERKHALAGLNYP